MKPRVVVIDDDKQSRKLLSLILQEKGYEVISFESPLVCPLYPDLEVECSHEQGCGDFLLTDNRMPVMTGLEFVKTQLNRGCKGAVKNRAVISGSWTEQEKRQAEELGCKVFCKPYNVDAVLEWMEGRIKQIPAERRLATLKGYL